MVWPNQANQGATETMTWEVTHAALDLSVLSVIVLLGLGASHISSRERVSGGRSHLKCNSERIV